MGQSVPGKYPGPWAGPFPSSVILYKEDFPCVFHCCCLTPLLHPLSSCRHGQLCLPDAPGGCGWGPVYAVLLLKTGSVSGSRMGGVLGKLRPVEPSDDEGDEGEGEAVDEVEP